MLCLDRYTYVNDSLNLSQDSSKGLSDTWDGMEEAILAYPDVKQYPMDAYNLVSTIDKFLINITRHTSRNASAVVSLQVAILVYNQRRFCLASE